MCQTKIVLLNPCWPGPDRVLPCCVQAMKTYHVYHGESKQAESKLRYTESQKAKVEQHASKGTLSRKFKNFEKQTEKV